MPLHDSAGNKSINTSRLYMWLNDGMPTGTFGLVPGATAGRYSSGAFAYAIR
jgi:hypothetical protein